MRSQIQIMQTVFILLFVFILLTGAAMLYFRLTYYQDQVGRNDRLNENEKVRLHTLLASPDYQCMRYGVVKSWCIDINKVMAEDHPFFGNSVILSAWDDGWHELLRINATNDQSVHYVMPILFWVNQTPMQGKIEVWV